MSLKFFPTGFGWVGVGCRETKSSRGMQRGGFPLLGLPTPGQVGFPQFSFLFVSFIWDFFRNLLKWLGWAKLSLEDEDRVSCTGLCSSNPNWKVRWKTRIFPHGADIQLLFQEHSPLDISSPSITVRGETSSWFKFFSSLGGKLFQIHLTLQESSRPGAEEHWWSCTQGGISGITLPWDPGGAEGWQVITHSQGKQTTGHNFKENF